MRDFHCSEDFLTISGQGFTITFILQFLISLIKINFMGVCSNLEFLKSSMVENFFIIFISQSQSFFGKVLKITSSGFENSLSIFGSGEKIITKKKIFKDKTEEQNKM